MYAHLWNLTLRVSYRVESSSVRCKFLFSFYKILAPEVIYYIPFLISNFYYFPNKFWFANATGVLYHQKCCLHIQVLIFEAGGTLDPWYFTWSCFSQLFSCPINRFIGFHAISKYLRTFCSFVYSQDRNLIGKFVHIKMIDLWSFICLSSHVEAQNLKVLIMTVPFLRKETMRTKVNFVWKSKKYIGKLP